MCTSHLWVVVTVLGSAGLTSVCESHTMTPHCTKLLFDRDKFQIPAGKSLSTQPQILFYRKAADKTLLNINKGEGVFFGLTHPSQAPHPPPWKLSRQCCETRPVCLFSEISWSWRILLPLHGSRVYC